MSAKRSIVVRIDGHKDRKSSSDEGYNRKERGTLAREEAAAAEESSDRIHTFAREYDQSLMISKGSMKKKSSFSMFRPIIIAIISALAIGSIMGFVMLKIIVNFDNGLNTTPAIVLPANSGEDENDGNSASAESTLYTLGTMTAFVLQGGVYSESANAESETTKFTDLDFKPVIWERDNQFYLLVNVANSKATLQEEALSLANNNIEVYVKEWQISEADVELTKEEYNWITTFQEKWNTSLQQSTFEIDAWEKFIQDVPGQSKHLASLTTSLTDLLKGNENGTGSLLLEMAKAYEVWLNSFQ
jgi:stage II sporulation protein B